MCRFVHISLILSFSLVIKVEYDDLMQTINQFNETIKILQNNIVTKDATITALEKEESACVGTFT